MPRNVEIKARVHDAAALSKRVASIADDGPVLIEQEDIFFDSPRGRLKLRKLPAAAELIYYERLDHSGPKTSHYVRTPCQDPHGLTEILSRSLGVRGVIRKQRKLYRCGQTRIHLDTVEQLGEFLELEVVLRDDQDAAQGAEIARHIMRQLDVHEADLVSAAYIDLLPRT